MNAAETFKFTVLIKFKLPVFSYNLSVKGLYFPIIIFCKKVFLENPLDSLSVNLKQTLLSLKYYTSPKYGESIVRQDNIKEDEA
jgi:hypothetical protein